MPVQQDIEIWRGNSLPSIVWRFPDGYEPGPEIQFSVWIGRRKLFLVTSGSGLSVDSAGRKFIWSQTLEQSRLVPLGRVATYELEDRAGAGTETTISYGAITGLGGANDDDASAPASNSLDFSDPRNSSYGMMGWI